MAKKNNNNSDWMSRKQDEQTEQLEERLTALYANAENEIRAKWDDFMSGFEKEDTARRKLVESGSMPEDEYTAWRKTQILKSNQYSKAVESMSNMLVETDVAAMATVNEELPQVVAESYDFVQGLGFQAAEEAGLTSGTFQIYNARTVQALIKDNPDLMPKPTVDIPEDQRWSKERINREITQGIVQGESIPKIANRLRQVTTMDRNAAVRNARTAMTGAENLGRYQSAQDLRENGIPIEEVWMATPDDRTRESHRLLDGTTRDESGYFGVGIIDTPLRFAGDPLGAPEEVYNCRCRTGIVLQGIDHSQDGALYAEFMKQFEDGKEMIDGKIPEAQSQHPEPEQKTTEEIRAPEPIATSRSEDLPELKDLEPAEQLTSGSREIVQGENIVDTWNRDKEKYQFEIDNAVAAQGYNGLPRVVGEEEFNKAVKESGFIGQRAYSAPDQETLDAYRDQLYNGDWYVNCETGGAQYGQGMYCAADYNGELTDGIKAEMEHYRQLGESRNNERMTDEERVEAARNKLPEDIANNETAIEYLRALQSGSLSEQAKYYSMLDKETERAVSKALSETPLDKTAVNYTETLTLTPDAKIITYEQAQEEFKEYRHSHNYDTYMREAQQEVFKEMNLSTRERAEYRQIYTYYTTPSSPEKLARMHELEEKYGTTAQEIDRKFHDKYEEKAKNNINDIGTFCALKGYDAINAEGHGESGSYTVILNRTKVIFKRDET